MAGKKTISITRWVLTGTAVVTVIMAVIAFAYYTWISATMRNQLQETFEALVASTQARMNESIASIDSAAKEIGYHSEVQAVTFFSHPSEFFASTKAADEMLLSIKSNNRNVDGIFLCNRQGRIVIADNLHRRLFTQALADYWPDGDITLREPFFTKPYFEKDLVRTPYVFYFIPVHDVREGEASWLNNAVCAIACDVSKLINWVVVNDSSRSVMAVDYHGDIFAASRQLSAEERGALARVEQGRGQITLSGETYLTNAVTLPQFQWDLMYLAPESDLLGHAAQIRNLSFAMLLVSLLLFLAITLQAIRHLTRPVHQMASDMRAVRHGRYTRIRPTNVHELQEVSDGINRTLASIEAAHAVQQQSQDQLFQAQIAQNQAYLHAFRSQINPHFLFNTLECIRSMSRHHGVAPVEEMVHSLTLMFRYSLRSDMFVTVADEVRHLRHYMSIMQGRTQGRYRFILRIEDVAAQWAMPAMTLQPLVENAVTHAFEQRAEGCNILVEAGLCQQGGQTMLRVRVADNGSGVSQERLAEIAQALERPDDLARTAHIGLYNTHQRLRLLYGGAYALTMRSRVGHYFAISLTIPENPLTLDEADVNGGHGACIS